jgi:probable rRNA maturation factor
MPRGAPKPCRIDVAIKSDLWHEPAKMKSFLRRAIGQAAAALSTSGAELAIVLTDDSTIRTLNRDWRGVDAATNVLAFPTARAGGEPPHVGDIVLAYETIAREARAQRKPFAHHVAHLAVHGFLHLVGYDHQRDEEAEAMEQAECGILRRMAIPDPYRSRPGTAGVRISTATAAKQRAKLRTDNKPRTKLRTKLPTKTR